jgi:hypothetical protein
MLKSTLYEHARALGIVGPEAQIGSEGDEATGSDQTPINLNNYRAKRMG